MYAAASDDLDDLCNIVKSRAEAKAVETAMEEDDLDFIPTTVLEVQTGKRKRADKVRSYNMSNSFAPIRGVYSEKGRTQFKIIWLVRRQLTG